MIDLAIHILGGLLVVFGLGVCLWALIVGGLELWRDRDYRAEWRDYERGRGR